MIKKITTLILTATCFSLFADINTVIVPQDMIHAPSPGQGISFMGKVEYTMAPLVNDSAFVELSIVPSTGGNPLELTDVQGDVGKVIVNLNLPNEARKYTIFFQAKNPQSGVKYKAKIVAKVFETDGKKKVESLISSLTKSQKAGMMGGAGDGFNNSAAGSDVPAIYMSDGPHGIRPASTSGGYATLFPNCVTLACTWDTSLARKQGEAKGEEWRHWKKNCALGPAHNLIFHPQGGRSSEYSSEDPYLSGMIGAYDVMGLQSKGVIATIKHIAANQIENNRWSIIATMNERSLRELYLYNWKPMVVKGDAYGLMSAYNKVYSGVEDRKSCSAVNKYILDDVFRKEWGFRYLSMTDWNADLCTDLSYAMKYGVDIQMPKPEFYTAGALSSQPIELIDMHTRRILWTNQKIGSLVSGYKHEAYSNTVCNDAHRKTAREVGTSGIVLAKNSSSNVLPIPQKGKKIAITGPFANQWRQGPKGSSGISVKSEYQKSPKWGIENLLKSVGDGATTIVSDINSADYVIVFVGVDGEAEGSDRPSLSITSDGENAVKAALAAKPNNTIVVFTGGSTATPGSWSSAPAVVIAFYPGMEQAYCIADVLFGNVNPSGKLSVTFPNDASQLPAIPTLDKPEKHQYPASDEAHGYFRVNKKNQKPLFAFGHGLSYTTFAYSDLKVYPTTVKAGDRVIVSAKITNTGTRAGKEAVQLYLSMPENNSNLPVRVQDLRGFAKVSLEPGASTNVNFTLTSEEMQVWDPGSDGDFKGEGGWKVLPGAYKVRVAASSQLDLPTTSSQSSNFTVQ